MSGENKRNVRPVKVGGLVLDGKKIYIQSMLNVPSTDIEGSVKQAVELEKAGCEIVRAAIPNMEAVKLIPAIKEKISIPLVADIHFDYRLAIAAAEAGIDKIRINPGNIGSMDRVKAVVKACRERNIPIRIGVNGGSLEKELLAKYGSPTAEALVESAMGHVRILEQCDFEDIVISIKVSDVPATNQRRHGYLDAQYPLHLRVFRGRSTERMGLRHLSVWFLLCDSIRRNLGFHTDEPVKADICESILKAIGKCGGVRIVSCPTCGRTRIDLIGLAKKVEEATKDIDKDIKIAVMGCVVNGIGESGNADIGIAGGDGCAVIFSHGEKLRKVSEEEALPALLAEIEKL